MSHNITSLSERVVAKRVVAKGIAWLAVPRFSAEPGNLLGLHSLQFSGLANDKAVSHVSRQRAGS